MLVWHLVVESQQARLAVACRRCANHATLATDVVGVEVRWRAVVDGLLALWQEVLDILCVGYIWLGFGIWSLRYAGLAVAHLACIHKQCGAIGQDVETTLATSAIDEVNVEATFAPRWEGGASLNLCNLAFRASLCQFGLADAAAQNG